MTEILFLPKQVKKKTETTQETYNYRGSRISARQREKQERAFKLKREKKAAEALAGKSSNYLVLSCDIRVLIESRYALLRQNRSKPSKEVTQGRSKVYYDFGP